LNAKTYFFLIKLDVNFVFKEHDPAPKSVEKSDNSIGRKSSVEKLTLNGSTVMVISAIEIYI
jgi:hypothetical protein